MEQYFNDIATLVHKTNMYDYLVNTRKNIGLDPVEFSITSDFCESDVEQYEQTFEVTKHAVVTQKSGVAYNGEVMDRYKTL